MSTHDDNTRAMSSLLAERGHTHGDFAANGRVFESLMDTLMRAPNWPALAPSARLALTMTALKITRILTGLGDHYEHWHDGAGYLEREAQEILRRAQERAG